MNEPLVSILSPCYNVEQYLPQCIESIINQTHNNLQIVMIDDGSSDGTWNVLQNYAGKDSRIEVYRQENQGVASTRNNLLDKVKGEYVLFVDSDDWIEPDMVEFLVGKSLTHRADIVVCGMVVNETLVTNAYKEEFLTQDETIKRFLFHNELKGSLWNKLIKTSSLHNFRFDSRISYGEDALFCWDVLQWAHTIVITDRKLYHYRMNVNSISHQSFSNKKLTGHKVWTRICEETAERYPQYLPIAQARFCIEATLLLRDAAHCGYKTLSDIRLLQDTIKEYRYRLREVDVTSCKMKIFTYIACRSYWLAGKL